MTLLALIAPHVSKSDVIRAAILELGLDTTPANVLKLLRQHNVVWAVGNQPMMKSLLPRISCILADMRTGELLRHGAGRN